MIHICQINCHAGKKMVASGQDKKKTTSSPSCRKRKLCYFIWSDRWELPLSDCQAICGGKLALCFLSFILHVPTLSFRSQWQKCTGWSPSGPWTSHKILSWWQLPLKRFNPLHLLKGGTRSVSQVWGTGGRIWHGFVKTKGGDNVVVESLYRHRQSVHMGRDER